jgi:hypothetical protein
MIRGRGYYEVGHHTLTGKAQWSSRRNRTTDAGFPQPKFPARLSVADAPKYIGSTPLHPSRDRDACSMALSAYDERHGSREGASFDNNRRESRELSHDRVSTWQVQIGGPIA